MVQWLHQLQGEQEMQSVKWEEQLAVPQYQYQRRCSERTLSGEGMRAGNGQLAQWRELVRAHDNMVLLVVAELEQPQALKALKRICDVDAALLKNKHVKEKVLLRLKISAYPSTQVANLEQLFHSSLSLFIYVLYYYSYYKGSNHGTAVPLFTFVDAIMEQLFHS